MAQGKFVAYYRVSTKQQGVSGLGLESQRADVHRYLSGGQWVLLGEFTDVESGKNEERPQLKLAMELVRLTGATLLIAKLDRLSRNAHFLLGLEKAGVDFVAVDMPNANRLTVRLMAVIAQEEREMISARTKAALAAAKARGRVLGGWRGGPVVDNAKGREAMRARADQFAASLRPMIETWRQSGMTYARIAEALAERSIKTARGGNWTASRVREISLRAA